MSLIAYISFAWMYSVSREKKRERFEVDFRSNEAYYDIVPGTPQQVPSRLRGRSPPPLKLVFVKRRTAAIVFVAEDIESSKSVRIFFVLSL